MTENDAIAAASTITTAGSEQQPKGLSTTTRDTVRLSKQIALAANLLLEKGLLPDSLNAIFSAHATSMADSAYITPKKPHMSDFDGWGKVSEVSFTFKNNEPKRVHQVLDWLESNQIPFHMPDSHQLVVLDGRMINELFNGIARDYDQKHAESPGLLAQLNDVRMTVEEAQSSILRN